MKKINLEEILDSKIGNVDAESKDRIWYDDAILAMKEACRQAVERAAENAEIDWTENEKLIVTDTDFSFRDGDYNWCKIKINEESILNTINQIEEYGKDQS